MAPGWPQGQFIQQIPTASQSTIDGYQQYPNGIYQTTYQQPTFETNTFYTGAVQVLTNTRPPSAPNQQSQLTPRATNSNYSHTPSPVPTQQQQQQQQTTNRQYQEYNIQNPNFIPPATTPTGNTDNSQQSRPSSVNSVNPPTPNQNFNNQQQSQQPQPPQTSTVFTSTATFSPTSTNYVNATNNSGNAKPGYPQVISSPPQLVSHSSSGYPGSGQYSGGPSHETQWQQQEMMWNHQQQQHQQHNDNTDSAKNEVNYNHSDDYNHQSTNKMHNNMRTSSSEKVNLNTRIKTMILNKQQVDGNNKMDEKNNVEQQNNPPTGHFLWYSHHPYLNLMISGDGGNKENSNKCIPLLNKQKRMKMLPNNKTTMNNSNIVCDNNKQLPKNSTKFTSYKKPSFMSATEKKTLRCGNLRFSLGSHIFPKRSTTGNIPHCYCLTPEHDSGAFYTHLGIILWNIYVAFINIFQFFKVAQIIYTICDTNSNAVLACLVWQYVLKKCVILEKRAKIVTDVRLLDG